MRSSTCSARESLRFNWRPVEGARFYELEVNCYGCRGADRRRYREGGSPWHLRGGLGTRSPVYTGPGVEPLLPRAGGVGRVRWRV